MAPPHTTPPPQPTDLLDFWFADGLARGWPSTDQSSLWWGGGAVLDARITGRFGTRVRQALGGELADWENPAANRLALILLLDQFSRNVHRAQPTAFAGDARAQSLVLDGLARQMDLALPWAGRVFFYMPLMHAENLALQDECVRRFTTLMAEAPPGILGALQGNLKSALQHRAIILQFGRFPHRNAVLGRSSTAAETEFLRTGPRFGQ